MLFYLLKNRSRDEKHIKNNYNYGTCFVPNRCMLPMIKCSLDPSVLDQLNNSPFTAAQKLSLGHSHKTQPYHLT